MTRLLAPLSLASLLLAGGVAHAESMVIPSCSCNDDCQSYGYDVCMDGNCYRGDPATEGTPCAPCEAPLSECSGACFDLANDLRHCGGCNKACPGSSYGLYECVGGTCSCPETVCGTDCVPLDRDPNNCGACGNRCADMEICERGTCTCPTKSVNRALCGDECVDPLGDRRHCGACGRACGPGEICDNGTCTKDPWSPDAGSPATTTDAGLLVNDAGPPAAAAGQAQPLQTSGCSLGTPPLGAGLSSLLLLLVLASLVRRRR